VHTAYEYRNYQIGPYVDFDTVSKMIVIGTTIHEYAFRSDVLGND
jgi:hypothetical protein